MNRPLVSLLLLLPAAACTRSGGSPTCGIAMLAGPGLITAQLSNARATVTAPPRRVPDSLPVLVIQPQKNDRGAVIVSRDAEGKISMQFRGPAFPARGYGLLVVDDTSQRAMGVMVVDQEEPAGHPAIGTIIGGGTAPNLSGGRGGGGGVNKPRVPLFGGPPAPPPGARHARAAFRFWRSAGEFRFSTSRSAARCTRTWTASGPAPCFTATKRAIMPCA